MSPCALPLVAAFLFYASAARIPYRTPLFIDENSLSPVAKYGAAGPTVYEARNWVRIKHSGPRMSRVSVGGRLELECEANGSPPPTVQWYHNNQPASQGVDESNSIGGLRLGNVKARLVLDCVTPRHAGQYTCVAISGTETVTSLPSILSVSGNNASGLLPSCSQPMMSPPRVLAWSPNMMETIGNDVTLPCVTSGTPSPQVYWLDGQNRLISGDDLQTDDRYKVLDSGDLMISAVRWSDMGHFTCVAESPLGRDSVTTFLYPMSQDR
ncbi:neural/ectodermal development factor IMP-L2-like [Macrosteles quadrilineatus]|uniref:neural/ectodermal development factor IMP-L2-like n=1 Tax=Macrosteles quadrilineatus TaxID=74068 RepID=UPI0023E29213|nr:neural/ectodermal development factor IMP-L2-like [Macrosteles quadrilineatus]XP_054275470.1 neural/ectodermal development factor IMP-L2-like [Macrosteles quadrilineatus]